MNLSLMECVTRQTTRGADEQAAGVRQARWLVSLLRPHLSWAVAMLTPVLSGCAVPDETVQRLFACCGMDAGQARFVC